ncbi:MAG TPA: leucine--tRNA ligase [Candidatus Saccharimonadales bacterium]|nr:leucine--tRNA ligase [Candidatus Saccharimonadales bacterium]
MRRYDPKEIEPKWQRIWQESGTYTADLKSSKPKYIAMSMFNYPSGAGIHIGHAMNYTISDVKARFKRQQGFESYHPVGWDAFGLPAENYAIKAGVSPQESMAKIIPGYHKQYQAMGWSNDWEKEIATHLPEYYKWTQWIFAQMYRHGLAYQDVRMQWWCPIDNTVLANEQVIDGKCWRHDGPDDPPAEKREVRQWFFKITDYADELLRAIDGLDWTESVKLAQRNWIGKSKGAEIDFTLDFGDDEINARRDEDGKRAHITVFTTRPDTIYGATYLVLAPEHRWVQLALEHKTVLKNNDAVEDYVKKAGQKTEVQRQEAKEKTGVRLEGVSAINPANGREIPMFVADYVLEGYGTGAIMAVPAHDERDHEFAEKFDLPIVEVVTPPQPDTDDADCYTGEGVLVNSGPYTAMESSAAREKIVTDLEKDNVAKEVTNYKMRDWSVSRQRYWGAPIPIINCPKCGPVLVPDEDLPVVLPELTDFKPAGDGRSALARAKDWLVTDCPKCGGKGERETDTLDTYICSSWYMYRYFDPHNQEEIFDREMVKKWEPIDFYNGADHATAHLLYARFIGHFFKKIGLVDEPEPFKRFLFNGKVTAQDGTMFSKSKGNGVDPLEIIDQGYGADALRTYLMFAAPLELWARWDPRGVPGTYKFLNRLWTLVQEYDEAGSAEPAPGQEEKLLRATHKMIKKVTEDIEGSRYNTAIAALMECVNSLYKIKADSLAKNEAWRSALEKIVACAAPFAPHISEELWQRLGHSTSVHIDSWPAYDEKYLAEDNIAIAVQVNGKLRGQVEVPADSSEEVVVKAAKSDEKIAAYLTDKEVRKTIYVAGRLVNFVI